MVSRGRRIGPFLGGAVGALLLLLLVPSALGPATAAPAFAPLSGVSSTSTVDSAAGFAANAGYNAAYATETSDLADAAGTTSVVVLFDSPNSTLYDTPTSSSSDLSPSEFTSEYGLSPAAYASAESYFVSEGLSIEHAWPNRLALTVEGPSAAVGRAFATTLVSGRWQGAPVTYPATPPSLPSSIEAEVSSVVGLSTGFTTFSVPLATSSADPDSSGPISPAIARQIYDISGLYNLTSSPTYSTSESLAVVLWGNNGYDPSDISTFYSEYYPSNVPQPTLDPHPLDGANAPSSAALSDPDQAAVQELSLDLEWSGSIAAGATLEPVYVPEGTQAPDYSPSAADMTDALEEAVSLDPAAISMSFGTAESTDSSLASAWNSILAQAAKEGISVLAATGDLGGDTDYPCTGTASAQYPSTSPDVIAVGGTSVALQTNILGEVTGFSESGWSQSGGGFSTQFTAPSWETSNVPQIAANGYRGEPDVSATAADNLFYYDGGAATAGGTSFATPLWAGLVTELTALHGGSLGFLPPRLYAIGAGEANGKLAQGLADVTSGSNCIASAGPGWDEVTGWGSPRGVTLYEEMTATFVNLSIAASPADTPPGGAITISAHLANATTGAAIVGAEVEITFSSDESLGPCTGTFGTADQPTNADGNVSTSIPVPWCYLGSHAIAAVSVTTGGLYGVNSTSVGVDLLAFAPFLDGITSYPENVIAFVVIAAIAIAIGLAISSHYPVTPVPPEVRAVRRRRTAPASPPPPGPPAPSAPSPAPPPPSAPAPSPAAPPAPPPPPPGAGGGTGTG